MSVPNVLFKIGYVRHEEQLSTDFLREKYGGERRFYSCNQKYNYVSYTNDGSKEKIDYIAYSGDGEKSSGVFTKDGLLNKEQQQKLKEKLRKTKSVIWHGFISFQQEFGQRYMAGVEEAMRLMNAEMPAFLRSAGFNPENITWYAGLHENTTKKHIHYSFFENSPSRYRQRQEGDKLHYSDGIISKKFLNLFKIRIEQRLTDISAELKIARKELLTLSRGLLFSKENRKSYMGEIQDSMLELSRKLPNEGRLSYNSDSMAHLRPAINRIVYMLPKSNRRFYEAFDGYFNEAMRRDEKTRQMLVSQGINKKYWSEYLTADRLLEDMYRRIGNYVINSVKYFKKKEGRGKSRYIRKHLRKKSTLDILEHCAKLSADAEREAIETFNEYIEKLEEEKVPGGEQEVEME